MIEKNIFQSWCTRDLHPTIQAKIDRMKQMNPDYEYHLFLDEEMDQFVKENYPGQIADCYHRLNIIVAKVDFWRYLVLYKHGGVYLDMDSFLEDPLSSFVRPEDDAIVTAENNPDMFVQWGLLFKKGHPILKRVIDLIVENIVNNSYPNDIHKMTGPAVYSKAIQDVFCEYHDGSVLKHSEITQQTDATYYLKDDFSFRILGKDYNRHLQFKYPETDLLYQGKKHWTMVQRYVSLLK